MSIESLRRRATWLFAALAVLVVVDLALVLLSQTYRDLLGQTSGWHDVLTRTAPGLLMIAFYSFYFSVNGPGPRKDQLIKVHGVVFGLIGAAMMIPWIGLFAAACSPIAVLFFGPLLLSPHYVWVSYSMTALFFVINVGLVLATMRSERSAEASRSR